MTVNKKGGKHKYRKRVRNNTETQRKNPKNIAEARSSEGTYYAKVVSRGLGNRRFKIRVPEFKDKEYVAQVRGSKQMKYKCPRAKEGCWVIAGHSEYDDKMTIYWVFKDWEVDYLKKKKIIIEKEIDDDEFETFIIDKSAQEKPEKIRNSEGYDVYADENFSSDEEEIIYYTDEKQKKKDLNKIDIDSI